MEPEFRQALDRKALWVDVGVDESWFIREYLASVCRSVPTVRPHSIYLNQIVGTLLG